MIRDNDRFFSFTQTDSVSDAVLTLAKSLTDNSSIWDKILTNVASVTDFLSDTQLLSGADGGVMDVARRLIFKIMKEIDNPKPWQGFDNE